MSNMYYFARDLVFRAKSLRRRRCSASFLEEFFSETQLTLPAKRRSFGSCQCPPRVGKHYQNYDEDCHYLRYCDNTFQCSPWRHEYPRRSQKEVERTNNNGGPVAPWFEQTSPLNVRRIGGVTMAENHISTRPTLARKPHSYKVDEGLVVRFLCHANSTHV